MKIIIIGTTASSIYGFRKELILSLITLEYTVYTFISEYSDSELKKIISLGAIPVIYKLDRGGLNPLSDIIATLKLTLQIKKIRPDIVFPFASKAVIYGTLAAYFAKVPRIVGMLEGLGYTFTEKPEKLNLKSYSIKIIQVLLYKFAIPKLDLIIFLNHDDPKDLIKKYRIKAHKVEVLGGIGLDLQDYPYSQPPSISNGINFLFIGRLIKEKGVFEFVEAAKIVKEKYPRSRFTILGTIDKSNLGALKENELRNLLNEGILIYPGHVEDVRGWIADSHVFVLPSYREGIPRSTQEAMAIGRPILTTDVPGCRETVINDYNGFIVPPWDHKSLAKKMIYFIENPSKIYTMGKSSYDIASENFDSNRTNQKLIKLLGLS